MAISVYYNINHSCFRVDYSPHYADRSKKECYINNKNIMFVKFMDTPINFLDSLKFNKYRKPINELIADKLLNLSSHFRSRSIKKNNWYMWKK